jgi:imidazoleglycerol-phosphate dehydratase
MPEETKEPKKKRAEEMPAGVTLSLTVEGKGKADVNTGVGFLDHMLRVFAEHGQFDLTVQAKDDPALGAYRITEQVGSYLGEVLRKSTDLRDRYSRYGASIVPNQDALVLVSIDISGVPYCSFDMDLKKMKIQDFETEAVEGFFRSAAAKAGMTIHIKQMDGRNTYHLIEAAFKGFGRALSSALSQDQKTEGSAGKGVV